MGINRPILTNQIAENAIDFKMNVINSKIPPFWVRLRINLAEWPYCLFFIILDKTDSFSKT